jgi:uncharacterized protein
VVGTALEVGKKEGADLDVIELAAILHDVFENRETHSNIEGFRHEIEGAKEARKILKRLGVADKTIEAKCLFDADKLDCIGAIGVIRCAFVSFDHGQEFYREEKDIESYKRNNIRPDGTIIDFSKHSSNLEYELSLKHVAGRMHTKTGKKLARERMDYMGEFFKKLGSEMKGIL